MYNLSKFEGGMPLESLTSQIFSKDILLKHYFEIVWPIWGATGKDGLIAYEILPPSCI